MFKIVGLSALLVHFASSAGFNNFCTSFSSSIPPCTIALPRDLVFVLDKSNSMSESTVNGPLLDYAQQLYCSFDQSTGSQVGLVTFGADVKVELPMQPRTTDEW
jgi:hypothetical protein